jgi:hypothetical protein
MTRAGSISPARRAGIQLAATTTASSTATVPASVTGSCGATPNSSAHEPSARGRAGDAEHGAGSREEQRFDDDGPRDMPR